MNLSKRYKIIIFTLVIFGLIGGGFYIFFKKNIKTEEPIFFSNPVATSTPIKVVTTSSAMTTVSTAEKAAVKDVIPVGTDNFVVYLSASSTEQVASDLLDQGFIQKSNDFVSAFNSPNVSPGAYKLSKNFSVTDTIKVLKAKPFMKWVVVPPGLRKEEIAVLLQNALGWTLTQKKKFITVDTTSNKDYIEGVYSSDTYLIPVTESTSDVAKRLISKFNEKFAVYLPQFNAENIKWTSALTMASIVQREASGNADMPLIAGILWNRLNQGMALDVDSTLQYVRGDTGKGWWASISVADKKTDSSYNTYIYKGLPPHPISNPGIAAIDATLNPTKTDCLYYLHDSNRITHCAATYDEHLQNIQTYLKN
jgi:UPF0755 protein